MEVIRLFAGFDVREEVGYHVFASSVIRRASRPVQITALGECAMGEGSNAFTFSRFLVPYLCGFRGRAIFADASDMLVLEDLSRLDLIFDDRKAVQVVQHSYKTRHRMKYVGTSMECPNVDYPRKNWASLMVINCEHIAWSDMTPNRVSEMAEAGGRKLISLDWLDQSEIGALPASWNVLADEGQPIEGASLLHWTAGIPCFKHYADSPGADLWRAELASLSTFGG